MKKNINFQTVRFGFLATALLLISFAGNVGAEKYDIVHRAELQNTINVKTQIQYMGSVIADAAGKQENAKVVPLDVRGQFSFDQRMSDSSKSGPQAIRLFDHAAANIKTGSERKDSQLDKQNRLLLARIKSISSENNELQIASIGGALSQKEYELLKNPGDPLSFTGIFNKQNVEIGQKWEVDNDQLAGFLAYDRILSNSCKLMVKSVDAGAAKVYIFGKVRGEVDDVKADATIKGIAQFDLDKQAVTAIRIAIDEARRPGAFAPGFEGKIKVDTRITPSINADRLSKQRMAREFKGKKIKFSFQFDQPQYAYRLAHDADWRVIIAEQDEAVFRYIDDGLLIAQCNISEQPRRPQESPLSLSQFQQEVQQIIAQKEARIVEADRLTTSQGYAALRVAVKGVESNIPFLWHYYHVAAQDGRRVAMIFTIEEDAVDYLRGSDRALIDSLVFQPPRQATAPQATHANASRVSR